MIFPSNVEIGKYYSVPHILCKEFYKGVQNVLLPINTPLHDDVDYINFSTRHYHIDWRFVSNKIYNSIILYKRYPQLKTKNEQAYIICETNLQGDINIEGDVVYKRVKCQRQYSNINFHNEHQILYNTWPVKLQSAYCGKELKKNNAGQYVCPHKGAVIDLKYVDEFGFAVCPAHLLRFDVSTLKAINQLPNRIINGTSEMM